MDPFAKRLLEQFESCRLLGEEAVEAPAMPQPHSASPVSPVSSEKLKVDPPKYRSWRNSLVVITLLLAVTLLGQKWLSLTSLPRFPRSFRSLQIDDQATTTAPDTAPPEPVCPTEISKDIPATLVPSPTDPFFRIFI